MMKLRLFPPQKAPRVGQTLLYKLRLDQFPDDRNQVWRGTIEKIFIDINDRSRRRYYLIMAIKPGYYGDPELVYPEQVVGFE